MVSVFIWRSTRQLCNIFMSCSLNKMIPRGLCKNFGVSLYRQLASLLVAFGGIGVVVEYLKYRVATLKFGNKFFHAFYHLHSVALSSHIEHGC